MISITYSNQIETLYHLLKSSLFEDKNPFKKRILALPSPLMKSWIRQQLVNDEEFQICMGLDICYLSEAVNQLLQMMPNRIQSKTLPTQMELYFAIEKEIRSQKSEGRSPVWEPLINYLKHDHSSKRLLALSHHLANLFHRYGIYGGNVIANWKEDQWQKALWFRLFEGDHPWTYPAKLFNQVFWKEVAGSVQLDVFGLSAIPPLQYRFLQKIAEKIPVNIYALSPCREYWGDLCSNREIACIQKEWEAQGVALSSQEAMEELLMDRNVLLANLGKMGRKLHQMLDAEGSPTSVYLHHGMYEGQADNVISIASKPTLLRHVQNDLLLLKSPSTSEKIPIDAKDQSISVHVVPTKKREIEVLYHQILKIVAKEGITPNDVIVMAPDITEYEPFIQSVFGSQDSVLDFQIYDLQMQKEDLLTQGLMALLSLPTTRWDVQSVFQLLNHPCFQKKFYLNTSDVQLIKKWLESANVFWGCEKDHRKAILQREGVEDSQPDSKGTWEQGFEKLIYGFIFTYAEKNKGIIPSKIPLEGISGNLIPLASKFIKIIRSLKSDLDMLKEESRLSISDWIEYIYCLIDAYFYTDDLSNIQHVLEEVRKSGKAFDGETFSWGCLFKQLQSALEERSLTFRESHLQSVKFCSMLPMRAIPSKVVALIGMQEGVFPKITPNDSLDLIKHAKGVDYFPTSNEYDRFLFLESILSAREYLYISFPTIDEDGNRNVSCSLVVSELSEYLNEMYQFNSDTFMKSHSFHYPFSHYDYKEYSEVNYLPEKYFKVAQIYYNNSHKNAFKRFSQSELSHRENEQNCVDINQMFRFSKNPLKYFVNHVLGIYLEKNEVQNDSRLLLDGLDKFIFNQKALGSSFDSSCEEFKLEGRFASGVYEELNTSIYEKEFSEISEALKTFELLKEDIFTLILDPHCLLSEGIVDGEWRIPAIHLNDYTLVGKIENVSKKGITYFSRYDDSTFYKLYPQLLILNHLKMPFESAILSMKNKKRYPLEGLGSLEKYIDYYHSYQNRLCLLLPDWIPILLSNELDDFKKMINKMDPDIYMKWIFQNTYDDLFEDKLFKSLKEEADELFSKGLVKL